MIGVSDLMSRHRLDVTRDSLYRHIDTTRQINNDELTSCTTTTSSIAFWVLLSCLTAGLRMHQHEASSREGPGSQKYCHWWWAGCFAYIP
jgi:hypothetical protein